MNNNDKILTYKYATILNLRNPIACIHDMCICVCGGEQIINLKSFAYELGNEIHHARISLHPFLQIHNSVSPLFETLLLSLQCNIDAD